MQETSGLQPGFAQRLSRWLDRNFLELGREMRLSYLPPLMVYVAAGISGLTSIVGAFFIKDYLGLSAEFLAALGFWAMLPWAIKLPLGHLVDLIWDHKAGLVYLGATLIAISLLIMLGLLTDRPAMGAIMHADTWYVVSALLAPLGYVVQDVVADAMTVEAVPKVDDSGQPIAPAKLKLMHVTMQTLGRVAIIGGGFLVALLNVVMFSGTDEASKAEKLAVYINIYKISLIIPIVSIAGVMLATWLRRRAARDLAAKGFSKQQIKEMSVGQTEKTKANWWILGGSVAFGAISLIVGLGKFKYGQELIFVGSMAIVIFLMTRLMKELDPAARLMLLGTSILIFIFRATPNTGPGTQWWMIDKLHFDESFFSKLGLISTGLALVGLFALRRFMGERSIAYIIGFLTIVGTILSLPTLGMYFGLHEWTAAHTGGVVDARFIALIDTALESPLGQVSMVPMLAWIANSAPKHLKATFFAVMASFTNLALSLSQLGTKYVNQIYTVTREVKDQATGVISIPENYSELGMLLLTVILIGLTVPLLAIAVTRILGWRSA